MKKALIPSLLTGLVLLVGCSDSELQAPPPVEVVVTTAQLQPFHHTDNFLGRLEAAQDVKVQAKVSGYLKQRFFEDGQDVKKGDKLYAIDPGNYQASKEQAQADVDRAQASLNVAERNYERGKQLIATGVISAAQMDELEGKYFNAVGSLKSAEAILDNATINLDDSLIKSPIDGQIGRTEFYVGDLVGPESGPLTTIVNTQTVKAIFSIDQRLLLNLHKHDIEPGDNTGAPVAEALIKLSDDSIYQHKGTLDYLGNRVDEATGTVEVSATIPNPTNDLRHGQYVRVIVQAIKEENVLMVPQATVQADQLGAYVLVVDAQGKVGRGNIELGNRVKENVIVLSGLDNGQQVILQGVQKVKVGQTVVAKMVEKPASEPSEPEATKPETPTADAATP